MQTNVYKERYEVEKSITDNLRKELEIAYDRIKDLNLKRGDKIVVEGELKFDGMEEINKQIDELQTKAEKLNATLEKTKELTTDNLQTNVLSIKQAMEFICSELAKDKSNGSWYYSWQSNIAMAFFDVLPDFTDKHELCNVAAKRFLDNLTS